MDRKEFRAYDAMGRLLERTWAASPCTVAVERAAYQSRLNRGELAYVKINDYDGEDILHSQRPYPKGRKREIRSH